MTPSLARCAVVAAMFAAFPLGASLRTTTLYRTGTTSQGAGLAGIVVRDVNGDSKPEIVTCAAGSAFAWSYDGTGYTDTWYSPFVGCTGLSVVDRNGSNQVIVSSAVNYSSQNPTGPGYLYAFDATGFGPAVAKVQVSATEGVRDIAVGNVDGDAAMEIVALTKTKFFVYDAATFALEWSGTYGGHTVAIGDVEGDGVNEIVIADSATFTWTVINTATQALKASYSNQFTYAMAVGDVDNDGKAEIIGGTAPSTSGSIKVFNVDTLVVDALPINGDAIAVADGNNDGSNELLVSYNNVSQVFGYSVSGTTATKLWQIANPEFGVMGMAVGDPDGDGQKEVVWASGYLSSGPDRLFVGNANTQTREFDGPDLNGNFNIAVGDLEGDGDLEMVVLSASTDGSFNPSSMAVLDYATHKRVGTVPCPYGCGGQQIAIGQFDSDPQREILLYGATIRIFDGISFAQEWTNPTSPTYGAGPSYTTQVIVRNIDADPIDEILYATGEGKIQVLNGASSFAQFTSGPLGTIEDLDVADIDGDSVPDLVVGTYEGFYVFKTSDWSERTHVTLANSYDRRVAAMPGHFAVSTEVTFNTATLAMYTGDTLTQEWSCSLSGAIDDLGFFTLAGQSRLAAAMMDNTLLLFAPGGSTCPTTESVPDLLGLAGFNGTFHMAFQDVNGDGRPELLVGSPYNTTLAALGWSDEPRGDADSDGVVSDADLDALAAYLYGTRAAIQPAADVNGDNAIRPDDLFYLINYRRGTGAAPPGDPQ